MATFKKFGDLSTRLLSRNGPLFCVKRGKQMEYKEFVKLRKHPLWKGLDPGFYPETEEERLKAAEKYGMHPREYKPYPDDETSAGDYPDLPWISFDVRDPYYPWDCPTLKRNYEEPVHRRYDLLGPERCNYGVRFYVDLHKCTIIFIATLLGSFAFIFLFQNSNPCMTQKQYPGKGVHYTFEPLK